MTNLNGQRRIAVEDLGALPVAGEIEHLVGVTRTYITKPSGATSLVLMVESGTFRINMGHQTGLVVTAPAASVVDGSGSMKLVSGQTYVLTAPTEATVIGSAAGDILTYYWL